MSYGLLGLRNQMEGEARRGLNTLADQQRQQKRAEDQMDQAENTQKMSAVGMGAGFGMMAGGPVGAAIGAGIGLIASELF